MGAGNRARDIDRRRNRRRKSRRRRVRELQQALQKGRTHQDRLRIAQEFWLKARAAATR